MKKQNIYLLLLLPLLLSADFNIERINSVLSAIKFNNKPLLYYTTDTSFLNRLTIPKSNSLNSADIIIFPKINEGKKSVIVDCFNGLKKYKNSIGAIYIKKGRTQIMFVEERLKAKGFELPDKYKQYIIKECYLKELCFLN